MRRFLALSVAAIALAAAGCTAPLVLVPRSAQSINPSLERDCRAATSSEEAFRNCMGRDYNADLLSPKGKAEGLVSPSKPTGMEECLQLAGSSGDLAEACAYMYGGEAEGMAYHALRQAREETQTEAGLKRNGWHLAQMGVRPGTGCGYITYAGKLWEKCP